MRVAQPPDGHSWRRRGAGPVPCLPGGRRHRGAVNAGREPVAIAPWRRAVPAGAAPLVPPTAEVWFWVTQPWSKGLVSAEGRWFVVAFQNKPSAFSNKKVTLPLIQRGFLSWEIVMLLLCPQSVSQRRKG